MTGHKDTSCSFQIATVFDWFGLLNFAPYKLLSNVLMDPEHDFTSFVSNGCWFRATKAFPAAVVAGRTFARLITLRRFEIRYHVVDALADLSPTWPEGLRLFFTYLARAVFTDVSSFTLD